MDPSAGPFKPAGPSAASRSIGHDRIIADTEDTMSEVSIISSHYLKKHPELAGQKAGVFEQLTLPRSFKRAAMASDVEVEEAFPGAFDIIRGLNPDYFTVPYGTRVVMIKTSWPQNIHASIQMGIWSTITPVAHRIMAVWNARQHEAEKVLFLFGLQGTKQFCGLAEMSGPWDQAAEVEGWQGDSITEGMFPLTWIYVKNVPFFKFHHVRQDRHSAHIGNMWSGQHLESDVGRKVLEIYVTEAHLTNMLAWLRNNPPHAAYTDWRAPNDHAMGPQTRALDKFVGGTATAYAAHTAPTQMLNFHNGPQGPLANNNHVMAITGNVPPLTTPHAPPRATSGTNSTNNALPPHLDGTTEMAGNPRPGQVVSFIVDENHNYVQINHSPSPGPNPHPASFGHASPSRQQLEAYTPSRQHNVGHGRGMQNFRSQGDLRGNFVGGARGGQLGGMYGGNFGAPQGGQRGGMHGGNTGGFHRGHQRDMRMHNMRSQGDLRNFLGGSPQGGQRGGMYGGNVSSPRDGQQGVMHGGHVGVEQSNARGGTTVQRGDHADGDNSLGIVIPQQASPTSVTKAPTVQSPDPNNPYIFRIAAYPAGSRPHPLQHVVSMASLEADVQHTNQGAAHQAQQVPHLKPDPPRIENHEGVQYLSSGYETASENDGIKHYVRRRNSSESSYPSHFQSADSLAGFQPELTLSKAPVPKLTSTPKPMYEEGSKLAQTADWAANTPTQAPFQYPVPIDAITVPAHLRASYYHTKADLAKVANELAVVDPGTEEHFRLLAKNAELDNLLARMMTDNSGSHGHSDGSPYMRRARVASEGAYTTYSSSSFEKRNISPVRGEDGRPLYSISKNGSPPPARKALHSKQPSFTPSFHFRRDHSVANLVASPDASVHGDPANPSVAKSVVAKSGVADAESQAISDDDASGGIRLESWQFPHDFPNRWSADKQKPDLSSVPSLNLGS